MSECKASGCGCSSASIPLTESISVDSRAAVYRIDNMDCPTEEALIRNKLESLDGVSGLDFNLMQRRLTVSHQLDSLAPVEAALRTIGMQAQRIDTPIDSVRTVLTIAKMDCPTEEGLIRDKLTGMAGVVALDFNLIQRRLTVTHGPGALDAVLAALKAIGFDARLESDDTAGTVESAESFPKSNWWPMALAGVAATLSEVVYWINGGDHWFVVVLALVAIFTGGLSTYKCSAARKLAQFSAIISNG